MARHTFFSFQYERDIFRCNTVRNSWVTQDRVAAGFWDNSLWENAKQRGHDAIAKMILEGLYNTSVTVVLIGSETANREWINFEIIESSKRGNGLLGVYIHNIKSINGYTDTKGQNPFDYIFFNNNGTKTWFNTLYPTYDYVYDDGYHKLGDWIETAATKAGR
jgi:hypothetical protein